MHTTRINDFIPIFIDTATTTTPTTTTTLPHIATNAAYIHVDTLTDSPVRLLLTSVAIHPAVYSPNRI